MDSPYAHELRVAFAALRRAARISSAVRAEADLGVGRGSTVAKPDDLSPVTVADFAVQALLAATFAAAFPADRLVGEESAAQLRDNPALLDRVWTHLRRVAADNDDGDGGLCVVPDSSEHACELIDRCGAGVPGGDGAARAWVFDPIDGTQNFVRGALYAINVALLEGPEARQTVSAVACPGLSPDLDAGSAPIHDDSLDTAGGCLVFAVRGHGTHVRPLELFGDEVAVGARAVPRHAAQASELRSVTSMGSLASGLEDAHARAAAQLGMAWPGCNLLPWVLRWAALGLGVANTTFWAYRTRARRAKAWDHAGAMLLFEESGGVISDVDGKPINLAAGRLLNRNYGFVAAPANWHSRVLAAVRDALREDGTIEMADDDVA